MSQGPVDKSRVVAAVEKYLAGRGTSPAPTSTAEIVDRFLAKRTGAAPPPPVEAPKPSAVDFVCENDVREAIRDGKTISICAKTIITPAARDLAGQQRGEVLVMVRSPEQKPKAVPPTEY